MRMEKFYYTRESAIIADSLADALMIAHDNGDMTDRQYCEECMNIVKDLLRLDILKNTVKTVKTYEEKKVSTHNWVKERMSREEKRRKRKVNYHRHISFVYKPTRLNKL